MSEIEELVKNAIDEFGDRAHERFSVAGIGFVDCKSNDDLTNPDFCLEDAKSGDAIEFLYLGSWIDAEFIETFENAVVINFDDNEYGSGENKSKRHGTSIFNFDELRMKYPKKVKS